MLKRLTIIGKVMVKSGVERGWLNLSINQRGELKMKLKTCLNTDSQETMDRNRGKTG